MPNRLFYTVKLDSDFIINNNCKITGEKATFQYFKQKDKIISLADSQMLKTIRNIQHRQVDLEQLEEWYSERDIIKRRSNSPENRKRIQELQNNIYKMMYIPEYVTIVIKNIKHYEKLFKKGFYINDKKYTRFSCSASQARVNTVVFIDDSIKKEMQDMLNIKGMMFDENGYSIDKFAPSKYNAYFGLNSSAIRVVRTPRFCIVPDFCENDFVDVDYVIETDDFSDDEIERRTIEVEFNRFDGGGICTPQIAELWGLDLGLDYTPCQFCIRFSFAKGALNVFDIIEWCKEKNDGNYIIKDIYGDEVDLREIDVILTEGQTKRWSAWTSTEDYLKDCLSHGFVWGITRFTPKQDDKILVTNYQFLQTLRMSDDDIKELCSQTVDYIQGVTYKNIWYTLLFMLGKNMNEESLKEFMKTSDNYWLKSLICNHNLLNSKYSKEKIRDNLNKKIEQACIGKIMVDGNFQVLIPDSYALMEWVCYRDKDRVKGLLGPGEVYSRFWVDRNVDRVISQRSPLTHFSECHLVDVKNSEELLKWYKYDYTGFVVNVHDDCTMRWAGSDWDKYVNCPNMW